MPSTYLLESPQQGKVNQEQVVVKARRRTNQWTLS